MSPELPDLRPTPEVITVVGILDSVGKTTSAVNLAVACAAAGRVVLLIDLDLQSGISHSLVRGWHEGSGSSCLFTDAAVTREMIAATEIPDLYLLPSEESLNTLEARLAVVGDSRTRLAQGIETLRALPMRFDLILINCPSNLGLMTLNALAAAHWVLVPVPTTLNAVASTGIPALLLMIQRLRDGMRQTLRGVYLLPVQRTDADDTSTDAVQNRFGAMTLPFVIPWSAEVGEAKRQGKPVLVYALRNAVSVAYLNLAAGWLALMTETSASSETFLFPTHFIHADDADPDSTEGRAVWFRHTIEKRIQAWLVDPSCLLYDAEEAKRHPEVPSMDEFVKLTHPMISTRRSNPSEPLKNRSFWRRYHPWMAVGGTLLLLVALSWLTPASVRFEMAVWFIGPEQYWRAGSALLLRADETAYRELIFGTKLVGNNRRRLQACQEDALAKGTVVSCSVVMPPE